MLLFDQIQIERRALQPRPITFKEAQRFIAKHHRHNRPPRGCLVTVGLEDAHGVLVGVLVVGRPNARAYQDGYTAEVTRTCVVDCRNANSRLYGMARQIATLLGYRRLITYTREGESGSSLKASGFKMIAERRPRKNWSNSSVKLQHLRAKDEEQFVVRYLWEVQL